MAKRQSKNKGGAPKGNKNAEKWTVDATLSKLEEMQTIAIERNYFTLGKLCIDSGMNPHTWSELANKFKENAVVSTAIKRIERIVEANLNHKALEGDLNPTMAIFTLKNKHGWEDKRKTESTGPDGGPIQIEGLDADSLSPVERDRLRALLTKAANNGG